MTDFNQAYNITMKNEGGYSNDPRDHGGETWRGIARNYWHQWPGWAIFDQVKSQHPTNLERALEAAAGLEPMVLAFYKAQFWDCLLLTSLNCQQIADQLFDISVNMGTGIAAKMLQQAVNACSKIPIIVDEKVGAKTITAANNTDSENLYNKINELRKNRYEQIIAVNHPSPYLKIAGSVVSNHLKWKAAMWLSEKNKPVKKSLASTMLIKEMVNETLDIIDA